MNTFYIILQASHSGFRWVALLLLLLTTVYYFIKWQKASEYTKIDKALYTITLSLIHIQVLIGFGLYLLSPKVQFGAETMSVRILRFFTVEHVFIMLLAVVLFTIGAGKIKRKSNSKAKFKSGFVFAFIVLLIILAGIPWPFQALGAVWF